MSRCCIGRCTAGTAVHSLILCVCSFAANSQRSLELCEIKYQGNWASGCSQASNSSSLRPCNRSKRDATGAYLKG
ncbi:hypothetical protein B0H63DRAFT_284017 [Podospora didyma]|uniref:Secreted protein n=1 Tax=Podospora didyma TaxID=330526 RepID=A0AAE0K8P3_9PEZI|nr:hypothetical protein B0H63DRAFT_284017 [Podospora didyma]